MNMQDRLFACVAWQSAAMVTWVFALIVATVCASSYDNVRDIGIGITVLLVILALCLTIKSSMHYGVVYRYLLAKQRHEKD